MKALKLFTRFVLSVLLVLTVCSGSSQAVTQEWAAIYNSGGGFSDYSKDIALDPSGNIYVTGQSGPDGFEVSTVKYNPAGVQQWAQSYNHIPGGNYGDWANAIAVDSSGNVYVTGSTDNALNYYDVLTIKYSTTGVQQWAVVYNSTGSVYDEGHDIAVNSTTGDVYVTGRSAGNLIIIRYNSAGVQQLVNTYPGGTSACGYGIALNGSGHVYVTGTDGTIGYKTINLNSAVEF